MNEQDIYEGFGLWRRSAAAVSSGKGPARVVASGGRLVPW